MSTRRAVRPDAMVYRQTRRLSRRKRNIILPAVVIITIVVVFVLIVVWVKHHR
jgi:putative effector of murein hydrolase